MAILTWVSLFAMLTPSAADQPSVADLVTRLGAPKQTERQAAGEALDRIGRAALPALLKAREHRDPEIRERVELLIARIEARAVVAATTLRLDIRDRPVAEAVAMIEREAGMTIRPGAEPGSGAAKPSWPSARVTLAAAEPLPFWKMVDRLCEAGGMQRVYTLGGDSFFARASPFQLTLVPGRARPPASDTGALRVELLRVRYDRNLDYGNDNQRFGRSGLAIDERADPKTGETVRSFYRAELQVSAEPRLRIIGVGAVEAIAAIDEQGRSLAKVPNPGERRQREQFLRTNPHIDPALHPELRFRTGGTSTRWSNVAIPLAYPSPRARRIARLRGVIPVAVLSRRPEPLEVELKGAVGKTFGPGRTRITIHAITSPPGAEPTIDLSVEAPPDGPDEHVSACDPNGLRLQIHRPQDLVELRLEVLDAHHEPRFWQFTSAPTERTRGRMSIVIHRNNFQEELAAQGLRLRYWETTCAVTDLPFAFTDVPTP